MSYLDENTWRNVKCIVLSESTKSLVTQWSRIHLSMQETGVQSLGQEDPPEEGTATHSSILA